PARARRTAAPRSADVAGRRGGGGDRGVRRAGGRRAGGLLRPLPAPGRSRRDGSDRSAVVGGDDRPGLGGPDAADTAARPVLLVVDGALYRAPSPRPLAGSPAPVDVLPRRGPRPADAARLQPRPGADGRDLRGERAVPADDDGDLAGRISI